MSWLKFSAWLSVGMMLSGLCGSAYSQNDPRTPKDGGDARDSGRPRSGERSGGDRSGGERRGMSADREGDRPPRQEGPPREDGPNGPGANGPPRPFGPGGPRPGGPQEQGPPEQGPDGRGPEGDRPPAGRMPRENLEQMKIHDPDLFKLVTVDMELERQSHDAAHRYRDASKDERAEIKAKLAEIVNEHFGVRQKLRSLEVKRLEENLKELREKIEQRAKNQKSLVEKRLTELLGPEDDEHF